jgi:beta-glucosidase
VRVELDRRSFSYYDVQSGDWAVTPGDFEILVGRSSAAIELRRKLTFTE